MISNRSYGSKESVVNFLVSYSPIVLSYQSKVYTSILLFERALLDVPTSILTLDYHRAQQSSSSQQFNTIQMVCLLIF